MARSYATFDCGIWDPETGFCNLTAGAQRTYFMLVTQRDISACGTLALTLRRWGSTCAGSEVETWLGELAEAGYIMIDEATEEVLVRTFMKWDAGYKHAKRVQAVTSSVLAIRSVSIRNLAMEELARLGVSIPNGMPIDRESNANREAIDSYRSGLSNVTTSHTPETTLQEREPSTADAAAPLTGFCSKHPTGTEAPCGPCGTAARRLKASLAAEPERKRQAAAGRRAAIDACAVCDCDGWLINDAGEASAIKCDHTTYTRRTA